VTFVEWTLPFIYPEKMTTGVKILEVTLGLCLPVHHPGKVLSRNFLMIKSKYGSAQSCWNVTCYNSRMFRKQVLLTSVFHKEERSYATGHKMGTLGPHEATVPVRIPTNVKCCFIIEDKVLQSSCQLASMMSSMSCRLEHAHIYACLVQHVA
jgi:hypothetical protein